jgi:hypothetical protein
MELHLKIIGWLLVPLALIHFFFPKRFNWDKEFSNISLLNRQMIYVHTFFIALIVFLIGILCISSSRDLVNTGLGHRICLGLGIFWACRLFIQFFGYSPELWKRKKFETSIHILFSMVWTYLTAIFFIASWQ